MIGRTAAKAAQVGQAMGKAALTRRTGEAPAPIEDDAELDFSSLARYIFLRPFLPMVSIEYRQRGARFHSLPH